MGDMSEADRIQRDLDRTRDRMDKRLDQLSDKLSPGQLLDDLLKQFRGSAADDFTQGLTASIRNNPMPAALTGIGLAWLMATSPSGVARGGSTGRVQGAPEWESTEAFDAHLKDIETANERQRDEEETAYAHRLDQAKGTSIGVSQTEGESHESFAGRVSQGIAAIRDRLVQAGQAIGDKAGELAKSAGDAMGGVAKSAGSVGEQVAGSVQAMPQMAGDLYRSVVANPVLLGAVGLAIGAALGATIPLSETEEAALAPVSRSAHDAVKDAAQDVVDRGKQMAQKALDTGKDSVAAQGLSGDTSISEVAKDAQSGELIDGVKAVAKDVLAKAAEPVSSPKPQELQRDNQG